MANILRKPAVIAFLVAVISVTAMLLVDHTNFIINKLPPLAPPGTTFRAAQEAGAEITPSEIESPVKPPQPGPAPAAPANPTQQ